MSRYPVREPVVITGLGLITPLGSQIDTFWAALLAGRSGVRRVSQFDPTGLPCQIAGEIRDFDPADYMQPKSARRMSRASQITLAASQLAVADAGLDLQHLPSDRVGVYVGTGIGGVERLVEGIVVMRTQGASKINPFMVPSVLPNMLAFHICQRFGTTGPTSTITTACATGTQVVGEASEVIRRGRADVVIAAAAESLIKDYALAGFCAMRALPMHFNDRPQQASRPFDLRREGFVFSEGAACLILESKTHAEDRGAQTYAEVAGYASSSEGFNVAQPDPSGGGALRTMTWALEDAGVAPDEVDYINAHGTSTQLNDAHETLAIKRVFGKHAYNIPISSTKSMLGHAMGASGAIEAAVCALSITHNEIHPTINLEAADPECDLDYVANRSRRHEVRVALSNSFGLGGQNACLVLRRTEA